MTEEENTDITDLEDELKALFDKHKKVSVIVIIEHDETNEILIAGNMCRICGFEALAAHILENNIQHTRNEKVH